MKNQIVIVPFPFDDFSDLKIRPVLCLSEAVGKYDHIIVAFISTQISDAHELSDLIIFSTDADFSTTGLKTDSVIRLHRLMSMPKSAVRRKLGELPEIYRADVENRLKSLLELP